jgi:hypothetical protein
MNSSHAPLQAVADRWNLLFFARRSMPIAGVIRICYGTLLLINMLCLAPYLELWFTEAGPIPLAAARAILDPDAWIPFAWLPNSDSALTVWLSFTVMLVQIVCLIAGFYARFQAASIFFWLVAFHHRNVLVFDGEDVLFRLLAFYLIWLPAGAYFALDALNDQRPVSERRYPVWPLRLLQIQMTLVYLSTLGEKLRGTDWFDGTALYYVSRLDDLFGRFPLPSAVLDCLTCLKVVSWSVLLVEFLIPCLLWNRRTRLLGLALAVPFHLGIDYSMNLNLFHWIMLTGLLSFVDWKPRSPENLT